jgi:hypothetical protein
VASHTALLASLKTSKDDSGGGSGLRGMPASIGRKVRRFKISPAVAWAKRVDAGDLLKRRPALGGGAGPQITQDVPEGAAT